MSRKRKSMQRLNTEALETRQMMAADVTASLSGSTLVINEKSGHQGLNQSIQIQSFANGIRVTGFLGSLVNNKPSADFLGVTRVEVNLGAGSDRVNLTGVGSGRDFSIRTTSPNSFVSDNDVVGVFNFTSFGSLFIDTGAGQDIVSMSNSTIGLFNKSVIVNTGVITAAGDSDQDTVFISGVTTRGITAISTNASNDFVTVVSSRLGSPGTGTVMIDTGKGSDTLKLGPDSNAVGNLEVLGNLIVVTGHDLDSERDTVQMKDVFVDQTLFLELGGGDDSLDMVHVEAKNMTLKGLKGNDTMKLTEVEALENLFALMGEGNDILDLTFVKARVAMTLDGGTGFDRLERKQMPPTPKVTLKGWELINGLPTLSSKGSRNKLGIPMNQI